MVLTVAALSLSRLDAQSSKGVPVCLGTDGVLRSAVADRCPQGQRMARLVEMDGTIGTTKDRDDAQDKVVADLRTRVDTLTKRVASLESELGKRDDATAQAKVRAPFEVVDAAGNPIFVVTDADYTSAPRKGRIHIGRATGGSNYSLLARNASGMVVVALGEGRDTGSGIMQVADGTGTVRARLASVDGLEVLNAKGGIIAQIKSGSGGAGQFWMYDASGTPMIKAGTTEGNVGLLQAGPGSRCVPTPGLAIPDCIRGRQLK